MDKHWKANAKSASEAQSASRSQTDFKARRRLPSMPMVPLSLLSSLALPSPLHARIILFYFLSLKPDTILSLTSQSKQTLMPRIHLPSKAEHEGRQEHPLSTLTHSRHAHQRDQRQGPMLYHQTTAYTTQVH